MEVKDFSSLHIYSKKELTTEDTKEICEIMKNLSMFNKVLDNQ